MILTTTVQATWTTQELREIDQVGISAGNQAKGMSKEALEKAIKQLEKEITAKEKDETYEGSLMQAKDKMKLSSYRLEYNKKYGSNGSTGSSGSSGGSTHKGSSIVDPITDPSKYDPTGGNVDNGRVAQIGGTIVGIIRTVGSVVALIALVILGLKYMMGSTADKSKYKESMIPYIIGIVMLVASVNILNILYKIFFNIY